MDIERVKNEVEKAHRAIEGTRLVVKAEESSSFDPREHEDKTRSQLARIFVWGYFVILSGGILLVLANNIVVQVFHLKPEIIVNVADIITTISAAIGTSLGFVVGYYFKSSELQERGL